MIEKVNNKNLVVAENIYTIFQLSYAVEAKLLKAKDFPPLNRTISSILGSENEFYGFYRDEQIAALVEIKHENLSTHIQSLVVSPKFFRQGIAGEIMAFVLNSFDAVKFYVETGVDNIPAIALYKKFKFIEVKQYDTNHGIRKICLEREVTH